MGGRRGFVGRGYVSVHSACYRYKVNGVGVFDLLRLEAHGTIVDQFHQATLSSFILFIYFQPPYLP